MEKQVAVLGTCRVCKEKTVQIFQYDRTSYLKKKGWVVYYMRLCSECYKRKKYVAEKALSYEYIAVNEWEEFFQQTNN